MVRAGTPGAGPRRISLSAVLLAGLGLSGCEGVGPTREASRAGSALELSAPVGPRAVERDVPAPQVFDVSDQGLWDGRPSLGGVWVAHPTARDPERVLIRNAETGAEVIGALFRRERENPGPRFQVSSEAAAALGILAGQPSGLEVTALRVERIESRPETPRATSATAQPDDEADAPSVAQDDAAAAPRDATATVGPEPEPAPRRGLRDLFRRQPAEPAPATLADAEPMPAVTSADPETTRPAPRRTAEPEGTAAAPTPLPSAPAEGRVEIADLDPEPEPRRGLFAAFRRRPAEPAPQTAPGVVPDGGITTTTLEPPAGADMVQTAATVPATTQAPVADQTQTQARSSAQPTGGAPLAGTAFLAEGNSAAAPPRRGLADLFRRQPAPAPHRDDDAAQAPLTDIAPPGL